MDKVFIEKFGCSADKVEMLKEHRFLSSKIGFSAANLLELFLEVEKEFGITFSKDEIFIFGGKSISSNQYFLN